jgi:hypothetical protein
MFLKAPEADPRGIPGLIKQRGAYDNETQT